MLTGCETVPTPSEVTTAAGQTFRNDVPFLTSQCRDVLVHGNAYDEDSFLEKGYSRPRLNKGFLWKKLPGSNLNKARFIRFNVTKNSCLFLTNGTLDLDQAGALIFSHLVSNGFVQDENGKKSKSKFPLRFGDKRYVFSGNSTSGQILFVLSANRR